MFAGVGCFSILIAKRSKARKVFSIDLNPVAVDYMRKNVKANQVYGKVVPILGDAKSVIEERGLDHIADRVLMPLPQKALEYLPSALSTLKPSGWVHYYDFELGNSEMDVIEKTKLRVSESLGVSSGGFEIFSSRIVRSTGPNWYQVVLDIKLAR